MKKLFSAWRKHYSGSVKTPIQQAEAVEHSILKKIDQVVAYPEKYPPDKFKRNNPGNNYRAFETHSYRVSYRYTKTEIRILRVRHVRQARACTESKKNIRIVEIRSNEIPFIPAFLNINFRFAWLIPRDKTHEIELSLAFFPGAAIARLRQAGKTTLN